MQRDRSFIIYYNGGALKRIDKENTFRYEMEINANAFSTFFFLIYSVDTLFCLFWLFFFLDETRLNEKLTNYIKTVYAYVILED